MRGHAPAVMDILFYLLFLEGFFFFFFFCFFLFFFLFFFFLFFFFLFFFSKPGRMESLARPLPSPSPHVASLSPVPPSGLFQSTDVSTFALPSLFLRDGTPWDANLLVAGQPSDRTFSSPCVLLPAL